jgi:hypothetical protein
MNRIRRLNRLSERNPGKTLLFCLVVVLMAYALYPADPPNLGVVAMSKGAT